MNKGQVPDKDFKKLYDAVVNSIFNSKDVQRIIQDLKEKEKITSVSIFALIIKLEELLNNAASPKKSHSSSGQAKKEIKNLKSKGTGEFIDGKELSSKEIAFEEFCRKSFDEGEWLKTNKLKI